MHLNPTAEMDGWVRGGLILVRNSECWLEAAPTAKTLGMHRERANEKEACLEGGAHVCICVLTMQLSEFMLSSRDVSAPHLPECLPLSLFITFPLLFQSLSFLSPSLLFFFYSFFFLTNHLLTLYYS